MTSTGNLVLTSADSSTSTIVINGGTLTLAGRQCTPATSLSGITVNAGGTLTLDNTGTNITIRLADNAPVTLGGGTLNFLGNKATNSTEAIGAITAARGNSVINSVSGTGASATLTAQSLTRTAGATISFQAGSGQSLGSAGTTANQITFSSLPSLSNGIITGATVTDATSFAGNTTGFNLATYGPNGVAALTSYTTLPPSGSSATTNYLVTSSTALTASESVNALLIVGDGITISGATGTTLTLSSGMLAGTGGTSTGNTVSVPTLALSSQEGVFITNNGAQTISSTLTGTAGVTFAGGGTSIVLGTNTYTGTTTLDSGTLAVGALTAIPTASPLALTGGTFQVASTFPANTPLSLSNAVTFNNSAVTFAGPNSVIFSGIVTLSGTNNQIAVVGATGGNAGVATFSGQIINGATAGNLTKQGAGTLFLTNTVVAASNYSGQTTIAGGILNIQTGLPSTTTTLVVAGGATLQLQGNLAVAQGFTLARPLFLNGSGVGGNGALESVFGTNTVSGTIALNTAATIGVDAGTVTQSGIISGPGDLTKVGGGTLAFTAANTYTGQTNINNGVTTVTINTTAFTLGSAVGAVVVASGATLQAERDRRYFRRQNACPQRHRLRGRQPRRGASSHVTANATHHLAGQRRRQPGRHHRCDDRRYPQPAGRRQRHRRPDQGRRRHREPSGKQHLHRQHRRR